MEITLKGWESVYDILFCDIRALAGILAGVAAWYFSQWLNERSVETLGRILLTVLEVGGFLFVFVSSIVIDPPLVFLKEILFFLSVSLSFSGKTYTTAIKGSVFNFLGQISLPIFCLQYGLREILRPLFPHHRALYCCLVIIAAGVVCYLIVEAGKKSILKRKKLNDRSPYEAFSFYHGEEVLSLLGCSKVAADAILLKPELLGI